MSTTAQLTYILPLLVASAVALGHTTNKPISAADVLSGHPSDSDLNLQKKWDGKGKLWDEKTGPKYQDIHQGPDNDWILCGLAGLAALDPYTLKQQKASAWDKKKAPASRLHDKRNSGDGEVDKTDVELYNIAEKKSVTVTPKYSDMTNHNSIAKGEETYYWWPGAQEKAAMLIGGNSYVDESGFYGGANASLGPQMLTGQKSMTVHVHGGVPDDEAQLWTTIIEVDFSPACVWSYNDEQWYTVLPSKLQGTSSLDINAHTDLYDTKTNKKFTWTWFEIRDNVNWISRLSESWECSGDCPK
ncbi:uncharacterized protein I303_105296 [Kwoniella dejecticola CBS 10117]|uniref:Calpain catalytic domain-containing protein n=1 Tax=Kwoniella dejecticola CBS 10117 TaxID=1296121 RepID=A0A1A6A2X0_9TREE|nr:uncharacterized protein I303_05256 [Kwoniella dejecticola CBS 10117]OBR84398.1 hypothetical protein I303_05256 [Kwoniella dejecticola CBS 10117]